MWTRGTIIRHTKTGLMWVVVRHTQYELELIRTDGNESKSLQGLSMGQVPGYEDTGERNESV